MKIDHKLLCCATAIASVFCTNIDAMDAEEDNKSSAVSSYTFPLPIDQFEKEFVRIQSEHLRSFCRLEGLSEKDTEDTIKHNIKYLKSIGLDSTITSLASIKDPEVAAFTQKYMISKLKEYKGPAESLGSEVCSIIGPAKIVELPSGWYNEGEQPSIDIESIASKTIALVGKSSQDTHGIDFEEWSEKIQKLSQDNPKQFARLIVVYSNNLKKAEAGEIDKREAYWNIVTAVNSLTGIMSHM